MHSCPVDSTMHLSTGWYCRWYCTISYGKPKIMCVVVGCRWSGHDPIFFGGYAKKYRRMYVVVGCRWSGHDPIFFGGFWRTLIHNVPISDDARLLQLGRCTTNDKDTRNHESNMLSVPVRIQPSQKNFTSSIHL